MGDRVSGKGGCVVRDADHNGTPIGKQIIDAVWNGDAGGIRAEIVIVDQARRPIPACSRVFEITDQFTLFGVDTHNGVAAALESVSQIAQVEELIVAVGTVVGGAFLVIDAKGIAHLMKETGDGVGADDDTEVGQGYGNFGRRTPRPLQTSDGITSGIVFEQELDQCQDVGGFFSAGLRPPPERRVRPDVTF